jgi:Dyp-type peroxidase family
VTTALPWPHRNAQQTALNVAVTFTGFRSLGLPRALLDQFPTAFRQSTRDRAEHLGDTGASDPSGWDAGLGTGEAQFLLTLNAASEELLVAERSRLRDLVDGVGSGLNVVHEQPAHALPGKREHFGYADGFSQPEIEGAERRGGRQAQLPGGGVPMDDGSGWRPLKAGEFLLGYEDEDGQVNQRPKAALTRNGTYMVYRKLRQEVAVFREGLRAAAQLTGMPVELIAAKVVGRWRDGVALEMHPDRAVEDLRDVASDVVINDFRYLPHDQSGFTCPIGAHIRRANPRDALGHGILSARHRLIRRGMPYGAELPPNAVEDPEVGDRGLIFVCFNADIERQFETVQATWLNDGDAFYLGADRDYLLGDTGGTGKMTIQGRPPAFIEARPDVVQTMGAEYLFVPGIAAVRLLAAGAFDEPDSA